MLGVDASVYSGEITTDKWREIKALGYQVAVIGLFHGQTANRFANRQCFAAREAGMITAGYIYLAPWTGMSGEEQVLTGLQMLGADLARNLSFVAIDCECDGITKEMIWQAVDTVRDEGLRAIIYTARWWWKDHFGDPHDFAGIPLWNAFYDNDPDVDYTKAPYGNWPLTLNVGIRAAQTTGIMGEQYAGTTYVCGVNSDLNWFDDRFIRQEEDDMSDEDWKKRRWSSGLLRKAAGFLQTAAGLCDIAWSDAEYAELAEMVQRAKVNIDAACSVLAHEGLGPETGDKKIEGLG